MWENFKGYISPLRDKVSKNFKRSNSIILVAALIVSGFFVFTAVAATHTTTVSVVPEYVAGGATDTYTFTVTNNGTDSVYKITVNIPTGSAFSINTGTISCPSGWTKDASSGSSKAVCITDAFGGDILISGNSADVSFNATSPAPGSDTEYTWSVVTKDVAAGYEFTNTDAKTTVDVTAPTTTDNATGADNWQTTKPITVTLTCSDASSGCANTYYCIDQANTCTPTTPGISVSVSNEGVNYVRYYSVDNVGNTETVKSAQVWIDTVKPESAAGPLDPYQNSLTINIPYTASDPGTSGLARVRLYKSTTGVMPGDYHAYYEIPEAPQEYSGTITFTATTEGTWYFYTRAVDVAGNVEDAPAQYDTQTFVDTTPPVVGPITLEPTIEGSAYTNANPTITAPITDEGGSGVASCEWLLEDLTAQGSWSGDGIWNSETGICEAYPQLPESPLTNGHTYSFNIRGIDNAGNEGVGTAKERTVDATPPTILNAGVTPIAYSTEGTDYVKGTITVFATVSDAVSGVNTVEFVVGSKSCSGIESSEHYWSCDIDTTDPLPDGEYTLIITATDKADNKAIDASVNFIIDNTPPETEKIVGESNYYAGEYEHNGSFFDVFFVTTHTEFSFHASDNTGVNEIWYRILWCPGFNPPEETCEDMEDWVEKIEWTLYWSQEWKMPIKEAKPFVIPQESMHIIEFYSVDKLGNVEQHKIEVDIVDDSPPVTKKSYGTPYHTDGMNEWITSETVITLNAVDPGPHPVGVNETKYRVYLCGSEPDDWLTYSAPFTIDEESCHVIEYYSVDLLGNEEEIKSQTVFVDNTPPELEKTVGDPQIEEEWGYYITTSTPITLTCEDPDTGNHPPADNVKILYRYSVDEGEPTDWTLYTDTIYFPEDSYHYLEYYCEDALGNKAGPYSQKYAVDITPPESYTESPELATARANEVQVEFEVCWDGDDNKVGIEKFNLWVKDGRDSGNPWVVWTPYEPPIGSGCASYRGTIGHTYCFKSRAIDYLGNYELDKDVGDEGVSCTDVVAFTFEISLVQGWNLISLPVVPIDRDIENVLGDITLGPKGVWAYDPLNPNAVEGWLTYAGPGVPSNLKTMNAGYGYWIDMSNSDVLTVAGTIMPVGGGILPPYRTLIPGWNLVGHYGVDVKEAYCALYPLYSTERWVQPLWGYENGSFFQVYGWDWMDPGYGYWMAISSALPENVVYMPGDCPE